MSECSHVELSNDPTMDIFLFPMTFLSVEVFTLGIWVLVHNKLVTWFRGKTRLNSAKGKKL